MKHLSYIRPMQTINVNKLIRYCTRLMLLSCAYSFGTNAAMCFWITALLLAVAELIPNPKKR